MQLCVLWHTNYVPVLLADLVILDILWDPEIKTEPKQMMRLSRRDTSPCTSHSSHLLWFFRWIRVFADFVALGSQHTLPSLR